MDQLRGRVLAGLFALVVFAAYPAEANQPPLDANGYSVLLPDASSRVVYVSRSLGSDSNDGLHPVVTGVVVAGVPQGPKRSITAGYNTLRDNFPDQLLLRRGDEWVATPGGDGFPGNWQKSGGTSGKWMVIGSYHEAPANCVQNPGHSSCERPLLRTAVDRPFFYSYVQEGYIGFKHDRLAITGLHFVGSGLNGSQDREAITFLNNWKNVLIEDNLVENFTRLVHESFNPVRLHVCCGPNPNGKLENIFVRRNVIHSTRALWRGGGLYIDAGHPTGPSDGSSVRNVLVEENSFDHCGVRTDNYEQTPVGDNGQAHCTYIGYNDGQVIDAVFRGNLVGFPDGGKFTSVNGIVEKNVFLRTAIGLLACCDTNTRVSGNLYWEGADYEPGTRRGWGLEIATPAPGLVLFENIIAHNRYGTGDSNYASLRGISINGSMNGARIERNIVYNWSRPNPEHLEAVTSFMQECRGGCSVVNSNVQFIANQLQMPVSGNVFAVDHARNNFPSSSNSGTGGISFSGNKYFAVNANNPGAGYSRFFPYDSMSCSQFLSRTNDLTGSCSSSATTFRNPDVDISTYLGLPFGDPTGVAAFFAQARKLNKLTYQASATPLRMASGVLAYARYWYGLDSGTPPAAVVTITGPSPAAVFEANVGATVSLVLSRTGSTAQALSVKLSLSSSAVNGTDYLLRDGATVLSGANPVVSIPAGAASKVLTVAAINNTTYSGTRWAKASIIPDAAYSVGGASSKVVAIGDNDGCQASLAFNGASVKLTGNEFIQFMNLYAAGNPRADFDVTGGLTANDFNAFLNAYNQGCGP
ncbi:MAG: GC-type dockerin domain-anchored protein [Bacteriovoracia bacterium]